MSGTFKIKFYIETSTDYQSMDDGDISSHRGTVSVTLRVKSSADGYGLEVYEQKFDFDETKDTEVVARNGVEVVTARFADVLSALMLKPT
jgi:hypothetical protein